MNNDKDQKQFEEEAQQTTEKSPEPVKGKNSPDTKQASEQDVQESEYGNRSYAAPDFGNNDDEQLNNIRQQIKSNKSFIALCRTLTAMNAKRLDKIIETLAKGDTSYAEALFSKPGGRKYLENIVLIVLNSLPQLQEEKEEFYFSFVDVLNMIEKRIKRQKEGEQILQQLPDLHTPE